MIKLNARKKELKEMFEAMGNITTETRVKITPEGITSTMVNPPNTAMLKLDLPKQVFQEYVVDEEKTIGLDLREWIRELQFERANDIAVILINAILKAKREVKIVSGLESLKGSFKGRV